MAGIEDVMKNFVDLGRDGGAEAHTLPACAGLGGELLEDPEQVGHESLVKHAIGLIQNEGAEVAELVLCSRVGKVVDEAAGGSDQDSWAPLEEPVEMECALAASDGKMALERRRAQAGQLVALVGNLLGKLACRGQHEQADLAGLQVLGGQEGLEDGQQEGDGLAGAGLGLDQGIAGEREGEDLLLHGRHVSVLHLLEGLEQLRLQAACHARVRRAIRLDGIHGVIGDCDGSVYGGSVCGGSGCEVPLAGGIERGALQAVEALALGAELGEVTNSHGGGLACRWSLESAIDGIAQRERKNS